MYDPMNGMFGGKKVVLIQVGSIHRIKLLVLFPLSLLLNVLVLVVTILAMLIGCLLNPFLLIATLIDIPFAIIKMLWETFNAAFLGRRRVKEENLPPNGQYQILEYQILNQNNVIVERWKP